MATSIMCATVLSAQRVATCRPTRSGRPVPTATSSQHQLRLRSANCGGSWASQQQQRRSTCTSAAAAAGEGEGGQPGEAASAPPGWEQAQRISTDALAMMQMGDGLTARIILRKGVSELNEQYPQDPSVALLHTQLWNLLNDEGEYAEALEQAQAAYDLMISYFGEDSADAAFHGIRLGISIIETNGDMDRAQVLLMRGGSTAASNLERFYTRLQEVEAAGQDPGELVSHTKKLMLALAESNFYGALGVVRKALQEADELEVPMSALEEAWVGGFKQMGMALPSEHPMFATACRELARLVPDAAGRPALQAELEGAQTKLKELLYLMKQVAPEDDLAVPAGQPAEEGYLP